MNAPQYSSLFLLSGFLLLILYSCGKETKKETKTETNQVEKSVKTSLNNTTQKSTVVFADVKINELYAHYLEVKKHLVNGDVKAVKKAAKHFETFLSKHQFETSFEATANLIALTRNLQKQRDFFKTLTTETEAVLKSATITSGELYTQFCPMAFEGKGGYWLSDSKEIRNPYYGEKMLKCGNIKEIIQ